MSKSWMKTRGVAVRAWQIAVVGAIVMAAGVGVGCRSAAKPAVSATKQYKVRGVVVATEPADGAVVLKHEAIAGLMEAMTMSYRLVDPTVISELHAGDEITATLNADEDAAGPTNMRLSDIVVVAQARPDYKPAVQYHVPQVGDAVPDFVLLNQDGKKIRLKDFRGKVLLMTFVYTRCPLADFCPRMSRNFAEIDQQLAQDKAMYAATHLLSVSFDPSYDTPAVLKSYGEAYTGRYTKETFAHWDFAAPEAAEMGAMEQWFDLGVTPGANGTLQHSLATLVIGKDGKVAGFWPTNDWAVGDLLAAVKRSS